MNKIISTKDRLFLASLLLVLTVLFRYPIVDTKDYVLIGSLALIYIVYLIDFFAFTIRQKPTSMLLKYIGSFSIIIAVGVMLFI